MLIDDFDEQPFVFCVASFKVTPIMFENVSNASVWAGSKYGCILFVQISMLWCHMQIMQTVTLYDAAVCN